MMGSKFPTPAPPYKKPEPSPPPPPRRPDTVSFTIHLPADAYNALERLRVMCGHGTLAETIKAALKLYREAADGR